MKPHETYRAVWFRDIKKARTTEGYRPLRWYQTINFTPGSYPVSVLVKYWNDKKFDSEDYHTACAEMPVEFVAPEWVILLGAVLGGILYACITMVREIQENQKIGRWFMTVVASILLSVIITILVSRIADSQFVIKVSVSDIWGAITVGFLANYAGWSLLDKMIPKQSSPSDIKKVS